MTYQVSQDLRGKPGRKFNLGGVKKTTGDNFY